MRPDLSRGAELKEKGPDDGRAPGDAHADHYLRYGALKGYIDGIMGTHGALFFRAVRRPAGQRRALPAAHQRRPEAG
jgi:hypothetical protein